MLDAAEGAAIEDIGLAGTVAAVVAAIGSDDQVVKAVAIDVPCRRDALAEIVTVCIPKNGEALPGGYMVDIDDGATGDHRTEAGGLAEDHIGFAGIRTPVTGEWRPDDQVVEAVAIDVPGRRETPAGTVTISTGG